MNNRNLDLTLLVPEFPEVPNIEISRDTLVGNLARSFGSDCQKQVVISNDHCGKTNLLSQFCRQYPNNSISYFITSNPLTQNYRNFLYVICNQISRILDNKNLPEDLKESTLRSVYTGLSVKLTEFARTENKKFYIVIDGIELALESEEGGEIVNNPPYSSLSGPYLLFSSSLSTFEKLPEQFIKGAKQQQFELALQFNYDDTEKYLSDLDLTSNEIKQINEKSKGVVGYLAILRDSIITSGKDWIKTGDLPNDLKKLISNQVNHVFSDAQTLIQSSVEVVAVAPKPINLQYLGEYFDEDIHSNELISTGLIIVDRDENEASIKSILAKDIIQERVGRRIIEIKQKLLSTVQNSSRQDDELLTLLLEELNDYGGLVALLDNNTIKKSIDAGNVSTVMERMRKASKLALDTNEIKETAKWSWGLAVVKKLLSHASTSDEINALIAIGESQKAIQMAYEIPETISKIRLLARVYTSMKDRLEHVSKVALNELKVMIDELEIEKLEKEVVQDIAADLLPLLPDIAATLLERTLGEENEQNLIDVAFSIAKSPNIERKEYFSESTSEKSSSRKFGRIDSSWLQGLILAYLIKEVEDLDNTKAKDFLIRQWCLQNTNHEELSYGIELWLDTVIRDEDFVITLRSLRKLSELLPNLNVKDRKRLGERFQISAIDSLRTPWEEWVGFHLNISEAFIDFDPESAANKVNIIYEIINTDINDLDIKVFCYARLWGAMRKMGLEGVDDVFSNLERVLSHLLKHAALQDEILNKTLRILAGIDINYALEVANRLNTIDRRKLAKIIILIDGYIKQPNKDLSVHFRSIIKEFGNYEKDELTLDLIEKLSDKKIIVDHESQKLFYYATRGITSNIDKSITLVNLASIWTNESVIGIPKILEEAHLSWQNENDLKNKIIVGFQLVEQIAQFDIEFAKSLYEDVKSTLVLPGAGLAVGELGVMYVNSIDLAIRSITRFDVTEEQSLEKFIYQIELLPATFLRSKLFAQLAAKIYSVGDYPVANAIVQDKLLQNLESINNQYIREKTIRFSLPVIFMYSRDIAVGLSKEISSAKINYSWLRVIVWSLAQGLMDDVQKIEPFKFTADHASIRDKALFALNQIKEDHGIYTGIKIITQSIENSVREQKIDTKNAFDILLDIENYAKENLPDNQNIRHEGYRIIAYARINGARSQIYKNLGRKGPFSKVDIRKRWQEIERMAKEKIENLADRSFVIAILAQEMYIWNSEKAKVLLKSISSEINNIPSLLDRSNRMENIANSWGMWGQEKQADFFYTQSIELIKELSPWDQDKRFEHIIQAAYEFSPDFADDLVQRLDSRFPGRELKPYRMQLKTLNYANNLRGLVHDSKNSQTQLQGLYIRLSTRRLFSDLVNKNGYLPSEKEILDLIYRSSFYEPSVVIDVLKWALECENNQRRSYKTGLFEIFIQASQFINDLANWMSPLPHINISQDVHSLLPGLSTNVVVFKAGQRIKAVNWVKNWITKNATEYIKICDPYFGPQELAFLSDIKRDIKILIVTTTKRFDNKEDSGLIRQELIQTWRKVGKGKIPPMTLLIVPEKLDRTFHDRAIVTNERGLDVGPSLNGLGNEVQRITELEYNEAKELETKYINIMLNNVEWILDHSIHPEYITI